MKRGRKRFGESKRFSPLKTWEENHRIAWHGELSQSDELQELALARIVISRAREIYFEREVPPDWTAIAPTLENYIDGSGALWGFYSNLYSDAVSKVLSALLGALERADHQYFKRLARLLNTHPPTHPVHLAMLELAAFSAGAKMFRTDWPDVHQPCFPQAGVPLHPAFSAYYLKATATGAWRHPGWSAVQLHRAIKSGSGGWATLAMCTVRHIRRVCMELGIVLNPPTLKTAGATDNC